MSDYFKPNSYSPSALKIADSIAVRPTDSQDVSRDLAMTIAQAADDRKGADIVLLNVAEVSYLTDYFVIVTGFSNVQVRAIARSIADKVAEVWNRFPKNSAGQTDSSWILQDYGDVIVHVFLPQEREFYNLEAFWGHAERIPFDGSGATAE